ncbi:MAG TPA: DUF1015 domain-containing protein [Clostridia bacterium]|nr:DUF1015 domain-containing protein [Clostridia bacterium]
MKDLPILLPNDNIDKNKWSVVSCDQFTSQRKYWKELEELVCCAPSTLKLIFPEVYLQDSDHDARIKNINQTMEEYLNAGVFKEIKDSFILVERETIYGKTRLGIVACVDLDDFVYDGSRKSPIRSTEGVVAERIPPRLKIRSGAAIELPHILLLIDDREKTIIEKFFKEREQLEKLYDFELNMYGGHLRGYRIDANEVIKEFEKLSSPEVQIEKYGCATNFVLAVGDGNHSLATAKAYWEELKSTLSDAEKENHPSRYALCEIENLHCEGIVFEPIHRCVFGADQNLIDEMASKLSGEGKLEIEFGDEITILNIPASTPQAISEIEKILSDYVNCHKGASIDYIHGEDNLLSVAKEAKAVAIKMPTINKNDLFLYVLDNGALCKKAFSMGDAEEKRYYYEAKRI